MTRVFDDSARFMEDMLEGFCSLHRSYVVPVDGGVVRVSGGFPGKVAVVVGGGSGHYPAFCGLVGPGFADGAIVGNIFTSPSAQDAIRVSAAASNGGGVILTAGNYTGDVLHFEEAAAQLTKNDIETRTIFITDDIASAPRGEEDNRRGIAGGFIVFKMMSAAAEAGLSLDEVLYVGRHANASTRTMGVAFSGCTLPGQSDPLFTVAPGKMGVGLGIHGEPGVSEDVVPAARELAEMLVSKVVDDLPFKRGSRVGVVLNGLGATKYEELFVLWRHVGPLLEGLELEIVHPEVGEIVTSLDMAGLSLSLVLLDDELEAFWTAGADTPAYKKGAPVSSGAHSQRTIPTFDFADATGIPEVSEESKLQAKRIVDMLGAMQEVLKAWEEELGRIDAVAGDGDHGRGMVKGVAAAADAAVDAVKHGAGVEHALKVAGEAWASKAGGTSGALYGAALRSVGESIGDRPEGIPDRAVLEAISAGFDAIQTLGKASVGDKTMLDSLGPFVTSLERHLDQNYDFGRAWELAARDATVAAEKTASLSPKIGRARPLARRSVGTPDAGATSMALLLTALSPFFPQKGERT
jgi:dihydroxyacetone kinase